MTRTIFAATLLAAATITATAPPAQAEPDCAYVFCGIINHHSPDAGFDAPFRVRCEASSGGRKWVSLAEGEGSGVDKGCADVIALRLRPNTQLHCDQRGNPFDSRRVLWRNAGKRTVTVSVSTNKSWNCTHQRAS